MLPHGPRAAILLPQPDMEAAVLHLARDALEVVAGRLSWLDGIPGADLSRCQAGSENGGHQCSLQSAL